MIEINYGIEVNNTKEVNDMMELKDMKVANLKEIAKEMNIRGWRTMRKDELVEAIKNNQSTTETEEIVVEDVQVVSEEIKDESNINVQVEDEIISKVDPVVLDELTPRKNKKRLLEYNGKTQTLTAWAKELGIRHQTLYNRIVMKGMDVTEAFEMSIKKAAIEGGDK